jgi:hypothetical protein
MCLVGFYWILVLLLAPVFGLTCAALVDSMLYPGLAAGILALPALLISSSVAPAPR